jgi:hypothetical protein
MIKMVRLKFHFATTVFRILAFNVSFVLGSFSFSRLSLRSGIMSKLGCFVKWLEFNVKL